MAVNSGLLLLDKLPTSHAIQHSGFTDYHPVTSLDSGPIEFVVTGTNEEYIDLNDVHLRVLIRVTLSDGTAIDASKHQVAFINSALSSLFSDVTLILNDKQVEGSQQHYGYKSYILQLLQYPSSVKRTHLAITGWIDDEAGKLDDATNTGFVKRAKQLDGSPVIELFGPLNLDLFRQDRYLLSHTSMRIRLKRAPEAFVLQDPTGTHKYKIEFKDALLQVRRALINPNIINAHAKGLLKNNAQYPVNHTDLKTYTIAKDVSTDIKENLFPTQVPKFIVIAFVTNTAYSGDYACNPYNFQHFNLNKLILSLNNRPVMGRALEPNFAQKHYALAYSNSLVALGQFNSSESNGMTYDMFGNGFTLFSFDLTADNQVYAAHRHAIPSGNIKLEVSFGSALAQTINVLVFSVSDNTLEITAERNVEFDYTI